MSFRFHSSSESLSYFFFLLFFNLFSFWTGWIETFWILRNNHYKFVTANYELLFRCVKNCHFWHLQLDVSFVILISRLTLNSRVYRFDISIVSFFAFQLVFFVCNSTRYLKWASYNAKKFRIRACPQECNGNYLDKYIREMRVCLGIHVRLCVHVFFYEFINYAHMHHTLSCNETPAC